MESIATAVKQWADAHPAAYSLVIVPVLTVLANALIWAMTSAKWDTFVEANPRLAALAKLLKAAGIDPVGIVKSLYTLVTGRQLPAPPAPPAAPSNDTTPKPPPPPPPVFPLAAAVMVVLALLVSGCSWMQSPKVVKFVADTEVAQDAARNAITQAAIAFEGAIKLVPADAQAKARARFDQAILAYTKADQAMTSLRKSALATQESPVDVAKVVRNLVDAVSTVISIADVFGGPDAGSFGAPSGFEPPEALGEARKSLASIEVPK